MMYFMRRDKHGIAMSHPPLHGPERDGRVVRPEWKKRYGWWKRRRRMRHCYWMGGHFWHMGDGWTMFCCQCPAVTENLSAEDGSKW